MRRLSPLALALLAGPATATVPDLFGSGARSLGLAGGGVALIDGAFSPAINPAGLTQLQQPVLAVGASAGIARLAALPPVAWDTNRDGLLDDQDAPLEVPSEVDDAVGAQLAVGRNLGSRMGFGAAAYVPAQRLFRFRTVEPALPTYLMLENRTQRYSLCAGFAAEPLRGVNLGVAVDFVPGVRLGTLLTADVTVSGNGSELSSASDLLTDVVLDLHEIEVDIIARFAPIFGVQLEVGEWLPALEGLVVGATYRGEVGLALDVDLDTQVNLTVEDLGDLEPYSLALVAQAGLNLFDHYLPPKVEVGVAWRRPSGVSAYADLRWTGWTGLTPSVAQVSEVDVTSPLVQVEDLFRDGNPVDLTLRDTLEGRAGLEVVLPRHTTARRWRYLEVTLRAGGGFAPTPLVAQTRDSAFLDASRGFGALGVGLEVWDPLGLTDAPVRLDLFGQAHVLVPGFVPHASTEPAPGFVLEGEGFPVEGSVVVFGGQIGFLY